MKHIFGIVALSVLLAACGDKSAPQGNPPQAASATAVAPTNGNPNWQTYTVGSQLTYPPFHYQGEKGEPLGFEMELLQAVAKAGEFNITVQNTPRKSLEDTLENGSIQIWSSTVSIKPERLEKMDFSQAFMNTDRNELILLDNDANKPLQKPEDLKGKKIAVNKFSKQNYEWATKLTGSESNVVVNDTYGLSMKDLFAGKVDAVLDNGLVLNNYIKNQKNVPATREILVSEEKKDFAFAVKKGNIEILSKLNKGLDKVKADGTYQKLVEKWFGKEKI